VKRGLAGSILVHAAAAIAAWVLWSPEAPAPPSAPTELALRAHPAPPRPDPPERMPEAVLPDTLAVAPAPAPAEDPPPLPLTDKEFDAPAPDGPPPVPTALEPRVIRRLRLPLEQTRPKPGTAMPSPASPPRKAEEPAPAEPAAQGGVSRPPLPPPAALRRVDYPARARRRGWEGAVVLRLRIDAEGAVGEVEVAESSGYRILDRAARDAVRFWTFQPALEDGSPDAAWVRQRIEFRLR